MCYLLPQYVVMGTVKDSVFPNGHIWRKIHLKQIPYVLDDILKK